MFALFELAPEVVLGIVVLSILCAYLAYRGMLTGWQYSFGLILVGLHGNGGLAGLLSYSKTIFGRHIGFDFGGPIRAANTAIVNTLQDRIKEAETGIAWTWHKMGQVWQANAEATNWLAHETTATFHWLTRVHLPKWLAVFAPPFLLTLLLPKLLRAILAHVKPGTVKLVKVIEHTVTRVVVHTAVKAATVAIPGAIGLPKVWHEIHGLTKRWARLNARLRKVEALFGVAAMAAAMANVLGLPNWRCLTRGNVGKTARKLCGLSPRALEDFLGLLADVLILQNICTVITLMEDGLSLIQPELEAFIGTAESQFIHCKYDLPPPLGALTLDLPPLTGVALSLP